MQTAGTNTSAKLATPFSTPQAPKTGNPPGGNGRLSLNLSLGKPLLGNELYLDLYLRNGFRILGLPAHAKPEAIARESGKFRSLTKLSPAMIDRSAIMTGYDRYIPREDVLESASRLKDPRFRLICEIFWLHLPDDLYAGIQASRRLDDDQILPMLNLAAEGKSGREGALIKHALAVLYHNRALRDEVAFAEGEPVWRERYWPLALAHWGETLQNKHFWDYLRERIAGYDDPRIRNEDLLLLKDRLPQIILESSAVLARHHAESNHAVCQRHLALMTEAPFNAKDLTAVLSGTVASIANKKLQPLVHRAEEALTQSTTKLKWREFRKKADPLLQEARSLLDFLARELALKDIGKKLGASVPGAEGGNTSPSSPFEGLLSHVQFDGLCSAVLDGLNQGIDYEFETNQAILYSLITTRTLLSMPVSVEMRRKLEAAARQDKKILYKDFDLPEGMDPTECWFLGGEVASPESSIILPVYKITKITGAQIGWSSRKVLIPRSAAAEAIHKGRRPDGPMENRQNSPAANALREQIEREKKQLEDALGPLQAKQSQIRKNIADKYAEQFRQITEALDREARATEPLTQAIKSEYDKVSAERKRRFIDELEGLETRCRPVLDEAAQQLRQAQQMRRSGSRILSVDLPLLLLGGALGWAAAYGLDFNFMLPRNLAGTPGMALGAGIGAIVGLGVSLFAQGRQVRRKKRQLANLNRQVEVTKTKLKQEYEADNNKLKETAKTKMAVITARLDALRGQKETFGAQVQTEIQKGEAKLEAEIKTIQQKYEKSIKQAEDKMVAMLKPKAESAGKDFPAYKTAKASGYQDGEKPSDSESQRLMSREFEKFKNSLESWEAMLLQRLMGVLSSSQSAQLLGLLMSMSTYERQQKLREFMSGAFR